MLISRYLVRAWVRGLEQAGKETKTSKVLLRRVCYRRRELQVMGNGSTELRIKKLCGLLHTAALHFKGYLIAHCRTQVLSIYA